MYPSRLTPVPETTRAPRFRPSIELLEDRLALSPYGVPVAWGANTGGQATVPAGLTQVVAIATGDGHSLALKSDGTVAAWGDNFSGQATVPAGLSQVVAIAGGGSHSLALKADGTLAAWGDNSEGQATVPAGLSQVVAIAGGDFHSLALKSDGIVVAWGGNGSGQATVPAGLSQVVAIAGGDNHSLALKSDGTVVAWGDNGSGQTTVPAGLSRVVAIAGGGSHSLALKADGTVAAWGYNFFGQTTVPAGLSQVVAIASGLEHSLALKSDGTMAGWGSSLYGELMVPAGLSNVVAIAGGNFLSVALPQEKQTLTTLAGGGQQALAGASFAVPLQVMVRDAASNPVAGAVVRFRAPSVGAGGTFAGGLTELLAVTNAQGIATAPAFIANDTPGSFTIRASVAGIDNPALFLLTNQGNTALLQTNPFLPSTKDLLVLGTAGSDIISIDPKGTSTTKVTVRINGVIRGTFTPTARIVIRGLDGNDIIGFSSKVAKKAWLYGGNGDDILTGGKGADLLLGGAGDDDLNGGGGRDVLIGGLGSDDLFGGTGDDILIGSITTHDADPAALNAITAEWARTDADYNTRRFHLLGTAGGGLNQSFLLKESGPQTVLDDADAPDTLTGEGNLDWFWSDFFMDTITDQAAGEAVNTILG